MILAWAAVAAALGGSSGRRRELTHLTVKVLAWRREPELRRLLASLDGAAYPSGATVDVEVHVDGLPAGSWFRPADRTARRERRAARPPAPKLYRFARARRRPPGPRVA